jgi:peptide/nickel transport system permease protein
MKPAIAAAIEELDPSAAPVRSEGIADTWRRLGRNRGAVVGLCVVAAYVAVAALAPIIAPYDPTAGDILARLQAPTPAHLLGTDELGRDILSRLMHGARISLQIQVAAALLAMTIGVTWGLVAGYFGGWIDDVSMRVIDVQLAFPSILLAIAIVTILGGGLINVIAAVGFASVPQFARVVRGVVMDLRHTEFVEAARAIGESDAAIMTRYVLPGTVAPVIVLTSLRMATVLLAASGLNFLGLGVQPPSPEWGAMLSNARDYMFAAPHVTTAPGLCITVVVIGFNLLGDGLRDALDPRMRD